MAGIKPRRHPYGRREYRHRNTHVQALSALIEGRLSSPDARADLVKLATRLIVEEALEAESRDALGREYYEHGAKPGQGYRNGHRPGRLKTAEGFVEYAAPQIAGREEGFRSAIRDNLKGRTEGIEELAVETSGAWPVGTGHRRHLHRRERPPSALAHGGIGAR